MPVPLHCEDAAAVAAHHHVDEVPLDQQAVLAVLLVGDEHGVPTYLLVLLLDPKRTRGLDGRLFGHAERMSRGQRSVSLAQGWA